MSILTQGSVLYSATRADLAPLANDPYGYCIAHFSLRTLDRDLRTVTFKFDDDSSITLNIRYEVDVALTDFDRVTAERDALQVLLTAANEREDAARAFVIRLIECAGGQPSIATGYLSDILDALKPAEGGGDE